MIYFISLFMYNSLPIMSQRHYKFFWRNDYASQNSSDYHHNYCFFAHEYFSSWSTFTSQNNSNLGVTLNIVNAWVGGHQGEVIIANSSNATISGWQLNFNSEAQINNIWSATISAHNGASYVISPMPWTIAVPANGQRSFGYIAAGPTDITQVALIDPSQLLIEAGN